MVRSDRMPVIIKTSAGKGGKREMAVGWTRTINPLVIGKNRAIGVAYITRAEVYCKLGRFKGAVAWLSFQFKSQEQQNEYKARLLQGQ